MPKVSELKDSKYLKKEDCPLSLTIARVERENIGIGEDQEMKWVLYFNEHPKGMIVNTTNGQIMAENFRDDEMYHWIGKHVDLYHDRNVVYKTKRTGGIRVRSIEPSVESVNKDIQEARELNKEVSDDQEIPF